MNLQKFLTLMKTKFFVLSSRSFIKESKIFQHEFFFGAITIDKKDELLNYDVTDLINIKENIKEELCIVVEYNDFFIKHIFQNIYTYTSIFKNFILFFSIVNKSNINTYLYTTNTDLINLQQIY